MVTEVVTVLLTVPDLGDDFDVHCKIAATMVVVVWLTTRSLLPQPSFSALTTC